jgi:SAM-dependent methyltransferase
MLRFVSRLLLVAAIASRIASSQQTERWNRFFSDPQASFNKQPNALMVKTVHGKKPGKALDIGMGQGRNALYLAQQGWDVTGVDISEVGINLARKRAAEAGCKLNAVLARFQDFDVGRSRWDLIVGMYVHGLITEHSERIIQGLKPNGMLVVEGFHRDVMEDLPHRTMPLGYTTNALFIPFRELRIKFYEDTFGYPDFSDRTGPVVRMIAVKAR